MIKCTHLPCKPGIAAGPFRVRELSTVQNENPCASPLLSPPYPVSLATCPLFSELGRRQFLPICEVFVLVLVEVFPCRPRRPASSSSYNSLLNGQFFQGQANTFLRPFGGKGLRVSTFGIPLLKRFSAVDYRLRTILDSLNRQPFNARDRKIVKDG
jgi:hypothetical protein